MGCCFGKTTERPKPPRRPSDALPRLPPPLSDAKPSPPQPLSRPIPTPLLPPLPPPPTTKTVPGSLSPEPERPQPSPPLLKLPPQVRQLEPIHCHNGDHGNPRQQEGLRSDKQGVSAGCEVLAEQAPEEAPSACRRGGEGPPGESSREEAPAAVAGAGQEGCRREGSGRGSSEECRAGEEGLWRDLEAEVELNGTGKGR